MTKRTRDYLKQEFKDGERPSGEDFSDLIESFLNEVDDGLTIGADGTLELPRGVRLGNSADAAPGTVRFNGTTIEFHDGSEWQDLAGGGGGVFQTVGGGSDVAYAAGNVGIGDFTGTPPSYRLEVNLGANTGTSEQVRLGNAVCSNGFAAFGGYAYFSHRNHADNNEYALRQGPNGNVHLNASAGQVVSIRQGGSKPLLGVSTSGNVIVGGESDLTTADAVLQVAGEAFKTSGTSAWTTPSDARLKEDVRDLETGLRELMQVRPVRFRYNGKAGTPAGRECVGVLGQEIEHVFPEMVQRVPHQLEDERDDEDLRLFNDSALTYVLVNAVKELADRVEKLEAALRKTATASDDGDELDGESRGEHPNIKLSSSR